MRAPASLLLAVVLLAAPARVEGAPERTSSPLSERLARLVSRAGFRPGKLGVCVVPLAEPALGSAFERDADLPLIPASTAKLATAAAVLDLVGPGHVFETTLSGPALVDGEGVLDGDLVLRGSGDPGLSKRDRESDPLWPLSSLAAAVARRGVRRVTGAVVLDDGGFDRSFLHPSWPASDLDDWYGAPVAGLTFNDSCVTVLVRGGAEPGLAATVLVPSTSGPWPVVAAVSTSDIRQPTVGAIWVDEKRRLRVSGEVPARSEAAFDTPVPDPLALVGGALVEALARAGVRVERGWRVATTREDRGARPGDVELARIENGVRGALRVMNKRSQNLYAELLFKLCGLEATGAGTWASGERAVDAVLSRRGLSTKGLRVVDGSGLSRENRLSARALAQLLASFDADPLRGPVLRESLAIPGEEGTLSRRFRGVPGRDRIRAKTGTLGRSGVFSLAGVVDGRPGSDAAARRGFAFAILANGAPATGDARSFEEDVVKELLVE